MATFSSTSYAFPSDSFLFQSLPKHRILTEVASNLCDHNGPTSEPSCWQKLLLILLQPCQAMPFPLTPFYSTLSQSIVYWQKLLLTSNPWAHNGPTSEPNYWQKLLLILVVIKQCLFLWLPSIPVCLSPPQMHLRGRTIKQCLFLWLPDGYIRVDILYLFLWLPSIPLSPKASYWQKLLPILVTIKLPFYSSLSQSILYWQKFLLIFATIMVPQSEPKYWQKLLLILVTIKRSLRIQSVYRLPKCTSTDGPFYSIFPWFHSIFPGFTWFSMVFLNFPWFYSTFPLFYSIFLWF